MTDLVQWVNQALSQPGPFALWAAFIWGILSLVLSPCHLTSIPLIVGFVHGQGSISKGRACALSSLFSVGILITIAVIGLITAAAGNMIGDLGPYGTYVVAGLFFLMGLALLDVINIDWAKPNTQRFQKGGLWAALVLGLVFGIALGPCTFAFMTPVLGITFKIASTHLVFAITLLTLYAIGHCLMIVLAGTFTSMLQHYLNWNERSHGAIWLKRICGVLILIAGVYMVYKA